MTTKNYFRVALENPESHVQELFGPKANGTLAQRIQREDPAQYASLRRDAVKLGLLEISSKEIGERIREQWDRAKNPVLNATQLEAVAKFPKASFRSISADQAARMRCENPEQYRLYRIAGSLHGYFHHELAEQLSTTDDSDDQTLYDVPQAIREKLQLDPSLRLTRAGLEKAGAAFAEACVREERDKGAATEQADLEKAA